MNLLRKFREKTVKNQLDFSYVPPVPQPWVLFRAPSTTPGCRKNARRWSSRIEAEASLPYTDLGDAPSSAGVVPARGDQLMHPAFRRFVVLFTVAFLGVVVLRCKVSA